MLLKEEIKLKSHNADIHYVIPFQGKQHITERKYELVKPKKLKVGNNKWKLT